MKIPTPIPAPIPPPFLCECLCLSPVLAFGIGIHRQRLTVRHLTPLQLLHKLRTEMRALVALRRGSVRRAHNSAPPHSPHPLRSAYPNWIARSDVSTRSFQTQPSAHAENEIKKASSLRDKSSSS